MNITTLSLGAGVQSTTLALLSIDGARRAERNLQIAGRRSSRHLEPGQPPTARWWRRTASRRR